LGRGIKKDSTSRQEYAKGAIISSSLRLQKGRRIQEYAEGAEWIIIKLWFKEK